MKQSIYSQIIASILGCGVICAGPFSPILRNAVIMTGATMATNSLVAYAKKRVGALVKPPLVTTDAIMSLNRPHKFTMPSRGGGNDVCVLRLGSRRFRSSAQKKSSVYYADILLPAEWCGKMVVVDLDRLWVVKSIQSLSSCSSELADRVTEVLGIGVDLIRTAAHTQLSPNDLRACGIALADGSFDYTAIPDLPYSLHASIIDCTGILNTYSPASMSALQQQAAQYAAVQSLAFGDNGTPLWIMGSLGVNSLIQRLITSRLLCSYAPLLSPGALPKAGLSAVITHGGMLALGVSGLIWYAGKNKAYHTALMERPSLKNRLLLHPLVGAVGTKTASILLSDMLKHQAYKGDMIVKGLSLCGIAELA